MNETIYSYRDLEGSPAMTCGGRSVFWGGLYGVGAWFLDREVIRMSDSEAIHYLLTGEVPRE